jgi:RimJ/RimL family protein N-acetyltransferase
MIKLVKLPHIYPDHIDWLNDKETTKYLSTTKADMDSCMRYINQLEKEGNDFFYIANDTFIDIFIIGTLTLRYNYTENYATIGIMIGEKNHLGKGFGQKAIQEAIKVVKKKGITEIRLGVHPDNISAIKCYEKVGFKTTNVEMRLNI